MQKFELILKNERVKSYKTLFLLFIFLNFGFLLAIAFSTEVKSVWSIVGLCLLMSAGGFAAQHFLKKKNKEYSGRGAAVVFILIAYVSLTNWWAAVGIAAVSFLYVISIRNLVVYINPKEIIYPSFPKKHLAWMDLNNMVLKDGILTIDFKNNRVAQSEVINGENDYDIDEKEFNDFCRLQLQTGR